MPHHAGHKIAEKCPIPGATEDVPDECVVELILKVPELTL